MARLEDLIQYPSHDVLEKAHQEMFYRPQQLERDLVHMKEWLKLQQHLPPSRLAEKDCFLKMFLTGCTGSVQTAKRKLDSYYSYRGRSEIYRNRDVLDRDYRLSCEANVYTVILPEITAAGDLVFITKLMSKEVKDYKPLHISKRMVNILEMMMRLRDVNTPTIVVFDWENFTAAQSVLLTPGLAQETLILMQDVFPTRIKKLIFFNVHPVIEVMLNSFIRPLLTKSIRERTIVTSAGAEVLHNYIEKSVLPRDFGGGGRSLKEYNDLWNEHEKSLSDWFVNELSEETDENKRIDLGCDKTINHYSNYRLQGTLKKLMID